MNNQSIEVNPELAEFARRVLLEWYESSARKFPWRIDTNPYHMLMAEMMLRRTRANQVVSVYLDFLEKFPNVKSLADASPEEVMQYLYPLGLSWRATNFQVLAKEVMLNHGGEIPEGREELLELTGVGPYVADAVRCFAFGKNSVLVDTNTVRVAARYLGFEYDQESRRKPAVIKAVTQLVDLEQPAYSNYALLDFAAIICRAHNPIHDNCPLAVYCSYYLNLQNSEYSQTENHTDHKLEEKNDSR